MNPRKNVSPADRYVATLALSHRAQAGPKTEPVTTMRAGDYAIVRLELPAGLGDKPQAYVPTSYGNGPDSRYFIRALASGNGGGGSSPVIADGTVYISFFTPITQLEPSLKGNPYWERTFKSAEHFQKEMTNAGANEREIATHTHRGASPVPLVVGDRSNRS